MNLVCFIVCPGRCRKDGRKKGEEDGRKLREEKGIEDHGWLMWEPKRKQETKGTGGMLQAL